MEYGHTHVDMCIDSSIFGSNHQWFEQDKLIQIS